MNLFAYYPDIAKKKIPLTLLGISSRVYTNWKKENLLYNSTGGTEEIKDTETKRKWVYLNVFDALWLSIVKDLRNLNLDLQSIRELKSFLYGNVELDNEKINALSKEDFVNSIVKHFPDNQREYAKHIFMKNDIDKLIEEINIETIIFLKNISSIIFSTLVLDQLVSIIIKKSAEDIEFHIVKLEKWGTIEEKEKNFNTILDQFANNAFINIPITPLLVNLFEDQNFDDYCYDFGLYTKTEKSILNALNNDEVKEIKISKHASGDITLNVTSQKELKDDVAKKIRKIIGLKQYEKIEVTYRNEKHLTVTNTRKEILEK